MIFNLYLARMTSIWFSVDVLNAFCHFLYSRCECGICQPMLTVREIVCCGEIGQIWQKIEDQRPEVQMSCITEHPGFRSNCLDVWVLETAYYAETTAWHRQDTSMFTIYSVILQSRYQLGKLWSNKEIDYFFSLVQEISLHCLQATRALLLRLSWQECEGRASILRSEQDPRHIPCRLWVFLHMVKATKPVKYIGQPFVKAVQTWKQS